MSAMTAHNPADPPTEPAGRGSTGLRGWAGDCFGLDVRSLAVFRICLGLIVLVDLGIRADDLPAFYTDSGIVPRSRLEGGGSGSVHAVGGSAAFERAVFAVHGAFALALVAGYRTRLAAFATCFLLHSLHVRNPYVLQGGDAFLRLLLFWGMFLPLGAYWSVDARGAPGPVPRRVRSVPAAALTLQVCFLYWFSAALKTDPAWRSDGTAVYYALSIDQLVKPAGQALLGFPNLMRALTHATFWLEAVGPSLLFVPVFRAPARVIAVFAFLAFHLVGLNLCMELGPFPYVCAAAWAAILPGAFWDRLAGWRGRRTGATGGVIRAATAINVLAAVLLAYISLWNLRAADPERFRGFFPQSLNPVGFGLGLDQYWAMFSPRPPTDDGWFVCHTTLRNGEEVDLLRHGRPVDWSKPPLVSALYPNERWRKFLMNIPGAGQDDNRTQLINHLRDSWDRTHPPERHVRELKLYFVLEQTLPGGGTAPPEPLLLGWYEAAATGAVPRGLGSRKVGRLD